MVYVDNANIKYRNMIMSHMIADTKEELLQMVDLIGINRKWIQKEGTYQEHFDICKKKKNQAIKNGAILVTSKELVRICMKKK